MQVGLRSGAAAVTCDGRCLRCLNIVDDFTRECLAIEVDRSLPGTRVVQVSRRLESGRGLLAAITVDHGPEFKKTRRWGAWAYTAGV